ncbi:MULTISPECIES: aspartyl-phosphate phosphatase Spo0E family protein [Bacillaceae]|uniref:aspartyl-phosphate phosphatase Spo0E family protein n=1 Tax=Bacillaceae TaxID=186817 RepID=UPI0003766796|nr:MULTISPECIES: aspartyl-phosphate phosphatase Spo0E family protein [Bacillaceae]
MNNHDHFHDLMIQIKTVRKLMISTGTAKGLSHTDTIKHSQHLDKLLNQFQLKCKF